MRSGTCSPTESSISSAAICADLPRIPGRQGDLEIFQHRKVVEDGRVLKGNSDSQ